MVRGVVLTWGVAVKTKITLSVTACHLSRRERLLRNGHCCFMSSAPPPGELAAKLTERAGLTLKPPSPRGGPRRGGGSGEEKFDAVRLTWYYPFQLNRER